MKNENVLKEKSYNFTIRMVNLQKYLNKKRKKYVISKQILRSGTYIGALAREAEFAHTKSDFVYKLNVALKEVNETDYWLMLLKDCNFISEKMYNSIEPDIKELIKLLVSSIKTAKEK